MQCFALIESKSSLNQIMLCRLFCFEKLIQKSFHQLHNLKLQPTRTQHDEMFNYRSLHINLVACKKYNSYLTTKSLEMWNYRTQLFCFYLQNAPSIVKKQ